MSDRLEEIKKKPVFTGSTGSVPNKLLFDDKDKDWLIEEVERLRSEVENKDFLGGKGCDWDISRDKPITRTGKKYLVWVKDTELLELGKTEIINNDIAEAACNSFMEVEL